MGLDLCFKLINGCLHGSGLSFNPDRTHSVSVEIIGEAMRLI